MAGPSGPLVPENVDGTSGSGTWDNGTLGSGTWSYDATTQILTISGTGETPDYTLSSSQPWYNSLPVGDYSSVTFIANVESGITKLGINSLSFALLKSVTLPDGLKTIGDYCFAMSGLNEIVFPSSLTSIGAKAFNGNAQLKNIYFKSTSAPTMGTNAFVLPNSGTLSANVYTVGWGSDAVFTDDIRNFTDFRPYKYTNFTYYTWTPIPGGSCGDNAEWEFDESTGTLRIFGSGAMDDYDSEMFVAPWISKGYLEQITSIVIESGITYVGACAFSCMDYTCSAVSVVIPSTVTIIGFKAFSNCQNLESVSIAEGLVELSLRAFAGCTALQSITLPSSVETIGQEAFSSCSSLSSITIPENVTEIRLRAFTDCRSLTEIIFLGSQPTLGDDSFSLGDQTTTRVTATVYSNGWASDDVFTSTVKDNYTTFIYKTLGGSAVTIPVNVNGTWMDATPYANVNGVWKEITVYMNVNGTWKESV